MIRDYPMMNILNGGSHADNKIDIQEFMVMPFGAKSFSEALQMGTEVFHHLKKVLKDKGLSTNVGDEGGFAPALESTERALDAIVKAIKSCGYILEKDFYLALDCASTEYYEKHRYNLVGENKSLSAIILSLFN